MENKHKNDDIRLVLTAVALVIGLIWLVRPFIMEEGAFRKIEGAIVNSSMGNNHYYIRLNTHRISFRANRTHSDVLREKAIVGERATIWYSIIPAGRSNPHNQYFIRKMIMDNEVIIPFRRGGVVVFSFIGIFLVFLIAIIIHFVKKARSGEINIETADNNGKYPPAGASQTPSHYITTKIMTKNNTPYAQSN